MKRLITILNDHHDSQRLSTLQLLIYSAICQVLNSAHVTRWETTPSLVAADQLIVGGSLNPAIEAVTIAVCTLQRFIDVHCVSLELASSWLSMRHTQQCNRQP